LQLPSILEVDSNEEVESQMASVAGIMAGDDVDGDFEGPNEGENVE
jgi:hypothetical protein